MKEEIYRFGQGDIARGALNFELAGISYCDGSYRIERMCSETACIEYVISGSGTVEIDGQKYRPKAGDSYFLQSGKDQRYYSDAREPWVKIWVNLSGPLLADLIVAYGLAGCYYFPDFYLKDLLDSVVIFAKEMRIDMNLHCSLIIHEILYRMHQVLKGEARANPQAERMKRYMDKRVEESIRMSELGELIGKSTSQVIRIFRESYGQTPYAYFHGQKIDLAKKLLQGSNMSIRAISAHLNFADEYYFSNVFKKHTGFAPQHYRRRTALPGGDMR